MGTLLTIYFLITFLPALLMATYGRKRIGNAVNNWHGQKPKAKIFIGVLFIVLLPYCIYVVAFASWYLYAERCWNWIWE